MSYDGLSGLVQIISVLFKLWHQKSRKLQFNSAFFKKIKKLRFHSALYHHKERLAYYGYNKNPTFFSVCVHIWFRSFASACCFSPSLQDRLLYLDIAEDFVAKAKRFYPPKDDSDEETPGLSVNLPLLLARIGAMNGGGEDEEEQSEKDDENLSDWAQDLWAAVIRDTKQGAVVINPGDLVDSFA